MYAVSLFHVNQTKNAIDVLMDLYAIIPNIEMENFERTDIRFNAQIINSIKINDEAFY